MDIETFMSTFRSVQEAAARDYPDARGACQILHKDLDLGATPIEGADEKAAETTARLKEAGIIEADFELSPDDLDFTIEHARLHALLRGYAAQSRMLGLDEEQTLALAILVGRRMGMKEAAELGEINWDDWSTGGDITGPSPEEA